MPSPSHDVLVQALRDDPTLLVSLIASVTGRELPGPAEPMDSAVRFSNPAEVRPDLVVRAGGAWLACEVQNRIDGRKARRWLLGAAVLHDAARTMGELIVITASRRVAGWARRVAHLVILETRGLTVTPAERARITACKEPARLTLRARQALSAASVAEALSDVGSTPPQRARPHRRRRSNGV